MPELLIGCGSNRGKMLVPGRPREWTKLVTCDINPAHMPDFVHDLNETPWPWEDNSFDELHGYEVWEHLGRQGDFRAFFAQFFEAWRILKPGGLLCGTSPSVRSPWLWGDPGHTRTIQGETFVYLSQAQHRRQLDCAPELRTAMTDYRFCWKGDFEPMLLTDDGETLRYVLKAVK